MHDPQSSSVLWPERLSDRMGVSLGLCVCVRVHVYVCVLSFSSCPVRGVAQSGVWGRRGCTAAYDWQPRYTIYTEPVREGERRNGLMDIKYEC